MTEMVYTALTVIYLSIHLPKTAQTQYSRAISLNITYKYRVGFQLLAMLQYRQCWLQQVDVL